MSAEMELERLVVRIVGDAKGYISALDEAEKRTRSFGEQVAQVMRGGGGPGGGVPSGGGNGPFGSHNFPGTPGPELARVQFAMAQQELATRQRLERQAYLEQVRNEKEAQAAVESLGNQKKRALEQQVKDQQQLAGDVGRKVVSEEQKSQQARVEASLKGMAQRQQVDERQAKDQQKTATDLGKKVVQEEQEAQRARVEASLKGMATREKADEQSRKTIDDARRKNAAEEQARLDRETKRLTNAAEKKEKEDQRRFEQSNRLKERADRDAIRQAERAEREKQRVARDAQVAQERADREASQRRQQAARDSAQLGQRIEATVYGVGKTAGAISAPVIYGAKLSVGAFASFDKAMVESISIMNNTEAETQKMTEMAKDLSISGKQGPDELAKSFYYMASAGMNAEQSIKALPQMQAFATAGMMDMALATSLANDTMKSMGMYSKDADQNLQGLTKVTDVLVKGAALSNANVQQLSMSISRTAGAAAKAFNRDIEETVAVLGAFADQGVKGELAGNRYSMLLRHLGASAIKHSQEQQQMGFAVFDSSGKMKSMGDIIQNLEEVMAPMSPQLRAAAMQAMGFEARMQQAILPLIGTSQVIKDYEKILRDAGGTTENVAKKQMAAFANQVEMTKNAVTVLGIEIGQMLAPVLATVADGVKTAVQWFRSLDPAVKTAIVAVVAFTTVSLAGIAGLILGLKAINILTGGFPLMVGLLVTGVAALGATAGVVVAKMGGIGKTVEYLKGLVGDVKEWLAPLKPYLDSLWKTVEQTFDSGLNYLKDVAVEVWQKISGGAEVDWNKVRDVIRDVILFAEYSLRNFKEASALAWAGIKYGWVAGLNFILANLGTILVGAATLDLFEIFGGNWKSMWQGMGDDSHDTLKTVTDNFAIFWRNVAALAQGRVTDLQRFERINLYDELRDQVTFTQGGVKIDAFDKMEKQLKEEFDNLKDKTKLGFKEFKQEWLVQQGIGDAIFKQLEDAKLPDQYNRKGQETGEQFVQGLNKGLKKHDFAEFASAEALARVTAYADVLGIGKRDSLSEFVKIGKQAGSFKVPEDNRRIRDEKNDEEGKGLLKRIANATESAAKKDAQHKNVKVVGF